MEEQNRRKFEFDLKEILWLFARKSWIILLTGVFVAAVMMLGAKLLVTPQYESVTKMYVLSKANGDTVTSMDMQTSLYLTKDYIELIKSRTVVENVIEKLELDISTEDLLNKIEVTAMTDTRVVTITVTDEDPRQARDLADQVREASAEQIMNVMNTEAVNVVDVANLPEEPCLPKIGAVGLVSGLAGILIAAAAVFFQYLFNDTIHTTDDVEKYLKLSVFGSIPMSGDAKKKGKYSRR